MDMVDNNVVTARREWGIKGLNGNGKRTRKILKRNILMFSVIKLNI